LILKATNQYPILREIMQDMKDVAFNMITKANDKVFNDNRGHPCEITNVYNAHHFLPHEGYLLFTFNSFHNAMKSTKLINWKYCSDYAKL
jgi:hypothetical protein